MTTNVPAPSFSAAGVSLPSESEIIVGLWADFQAAFNNLLNASDATPQGQLVTSLAAVLGANNDLFLEYVNMVDPALASGRMQDAIARIYYLSRVAATPTTVDCTLMGAAGTVIAADSLAQATDGTIYRCVGNVTIGMSGTVDAQFAATELGPIACPAGSLTTIYRVVPGWDSITNPADGIMGRDIETRTEFEGRRAESVAANSAGMIPSIRGAVLKVPGVSDAYVTENSTDAMVAVGSVSIPAHSMYVAVQGGDDQDVAQAIWTHKAPGCGYAGSTSVTVLDEASGYQPPYPSYTVKFQRPTALPVYFSVVIANNGQVPSSAATEIANAITAAFRGDDGGPRARIGSTIYALRFVSVIQALGPWAQIISITVGSSPSPTGTDIDAGINQIPTVIASHISVTLV